MTLNRRLSRLEDQRGDRERFEREREAELAASVAEFRRMTDSDVERALASGDLAFNPESSPRENIARALARGDLEEALRISDKALRASGLRS